jgi:hypothetical protein
MRDTKLLSAGLAMAFAVGCSSDDSSRFEAESAEQPISVGTTYTLVGFPSNKCVQFATTADLAEAQISTCDGSTRQQWRFESMGSGYYRVRNVASNKCLDVEGASTAIGARIVQWPCTTANNQQWQVIESTGIARLVARHSGHAADVSGGGTANGTRLVQSTNTGAISQQFRPTVVGPGGFACDGSTGGYTVTVIASGSTWTVRRGATTILTTTDTRAAIQAGVDALTVGRTTKESVLVQGSGSMAAGTRVSLTSYTILNVCGTITVTGSGTGDNAPIYARSRTDIDVPNVTIRGTPLYGMFFRQVDRLRIGRADIRVSSGLGIRIDNGADHPPTKSQTIQIDYAHVEGTGTHGVETYGVNNLSIGTVVARTTRDAGLLLNDTTNVQVGLVDANNAGTGTGYAAFRMANRNGRINNAYPTNVRVGQVIARGGGRGIFCVSESGGAVIDRIDIENTGNNSILIENCYNVTIAGQSGRVSGGGELRLAARTEFPNNSDIWIQNLTLTNLTVRESPCATNSNFLNLTLVNSSLQICP